MFVAGRWGDCQFAADRLATQFLGVYVDERHHQLPWRSSVCAKYAEALRPISLARRNAFTSHSSNLSRCRLLAASAAARVRRPASLRHQRRNVSVVQPILPIIERRAAHSEA